MQKILSHWATPFISGLFLVSLISGLALYFHIGPAGFHGMHEILSLVLIVPFVFHIWKNWRPSLVYFRRPSFWVAMAVSTAISVPFLLPMGEGETGGRAAMFGVVNRITAATPAELAPILDTTPEVIAAKLQAAGFAGAGADTALRDLATAAGREPMDALGALAD